MLKALRKKETVKKIFFILAIIIIPAFVFWGSGSVLRSRGKGLPDYAGRIFGRRVSFQEYQENLLAARNLAIMQFGDDLYKVQKYLNLNQQAWERLILLAEVNKKRIKVTDEELITKIKQIGYFHKDNKFNQKLYETAINYIFKTNARDFEEQMRSSLAIAKLYEQITQGLKVTEQELIDAYRQEFEKARVFFLPFPQEDLSGSISVQEEEIQNYFQAHKEEFKVPPQVDIEYIGFNYPEESNEYDRLNLQENLEKILPELKNPATWQNLSQEYKLTLKETGFFSMDGPIPGIGYSNEFSSISFGLKPDQISPVINLDSGCFVLRLRQKRDSYLPGIDEVKDMVKETLLRTKLKQEAKKQAEKTLEDIQMAQEKNPKLNFEQAAKRLNLKLEQTKEFSRNDYIPEVGYSKDFVSTAFSLRPGQLSPVIEVGSNFYLLWLDEVIPIDEDRLIKEKDEFRERLLAIKKEKKFAKFFADLKRKADLEDNIRDLNRKSENKF